MPNNAIVSAVTGLTRRRAAADRGPYRDRRDSPTARTRRWILGALAACSGAAVAFAVDPPTLRGPEVVKLDWNTRGLIAADLNHDGFTDLALINNDRGRIEILLQRPPGSIGKPSARRVTTNRWEPDLEDARFDKEPLTAGITLYDLAAGDLNGDGLVDLVYTGDPDAVTIRYQSATGGWKDKHVLDLGQPAQFLTALRIADLDGDGRADLLVLMQKELVVVRQNSRGELGAPERYAVSEENCFSLDLADLDGDGRKDVVYLAPGRRDGLRCRFQQPDGTLGPEIPFRVEPSKGSLVLVERPAATPAFAFVENQTGMLNVFTLVPEKKPTDALAALKPRVYSVRGSGKAAPAYAFGDFDGDGRLDVAATDAESAQVQIYFQNASGELREARTFPSLTDGRALAAADWDGDGRAELFIASPKEQTLGVASYTEAGRLSYPQPVPLKGRPLAVDAASLAAGQPPTVAVAVEEGGKRRVEFLARKSGAVVSTGSVELAGLRTDPKAIRFLDANDDGRMDLAIFVPFEAMRLLVQGVDGQFIDISNTPGFRRGLVENLEPAALTLVDLEGNGHRQMMIAGNGFARILKLDAGGVLQVTDQFNAREPNTDIAAGLVADIDGDGQREVVLLDRKGEQLQILRRNPQGVFVFSDVVPVGRIDLVGAAQMTLAGSGRNSLLFFGKDRFWMIPIGATDFRVDTLLTHETDLKDVTYGDVAGGDLNGDGQSDFAMIDPRRNLVEILARDQMTVKSVLHFQVFEADPHVQRKGGQGMEPRETLVADVTGDGKPDLVLLVHDRVLVYPQQ